METFKLKKDEKVVMWWRDYYEVEASNLEEAIQLIADNKVSPYDSQPMPECGFDPLEMEILDEDGVIVYES